jgi:Domain of unknown function (DUF4336)
MCVLSTTAQECLEMVRELEKVHGPVLHVILPTLAIEHKGEQRSLSAELAKHS